MRHRAETLLMAAVAAFALTGVVGMLLDAPPQSAHVVAPLQPVQPTADGRAWFESVRQYCNPVEVETRMQWQPAPESPDGQMHRAACYALAGHIDDARDVIESLPEQQQYQAAGVVFNAGHPAADAGDDIAAGPLMELVVEYWPNHYMALYHAGAARFALDDYSVAKGYLERFLVEYQIDDGWQSSAKSMLEQIAKR